MEVWTIWLIIAALLVLVELMTNAVAAFCVAVGCLAACVMDLMNFGFKAQLAGMAIATVLSLMVAIPIVRKRRAEKRERGERRGHSNMDALVGRVAVVTERIADEHSVGRVKVDGDSWQARSASGIAIEAGERVVVLAYDSIVLTVERKDN